MRFASINPVSASSHPPCPQDPSTPLLLSPGVTDVNKAPTARALASLRRQCALQRALHHHHERIGSRLRSLNIAGSTSSDRPGKHQRVTG